MVDTSVLEVVRPRARVEEVTDGDSYWMLVNWTRDRQAPWTGATLVRVRLRDYGARERYETSTEDPKGLGRVDGPTAWRLTKDVFAAASVILVEFQGLDDRGRLVCWVWVDGESLGEKLTALNVVARTITVG